MPLHARVTPHDTACAFGGHHFHNPYRRRVPPAGRLVTRAFLEQLRKPFTSAPTKTLNEGIATFYDESSGLWESMWGEHMHHGYYPKDGPKKSNQEAQIDMIEESLKWAGVTSVSKVSQECNSIYVQRVTRRLTNAPSCLADGGYRVRHRGQQQAYCAQVWRHCQGHNPQSSAGAPLIRLE